GAGGLPGGGPSGGVGAVAWVAWPADIVQKIILLLIFVLACSGAAALLDSAWAARSTGGATDDGAVNDRAVDDGAAGGSAPLLARLAAGGCYAWDPYVAERLQLGQWALARRYPAPPWGGRVPCA